MDAVDRIIGGLEKKNKIITSQEKKSIAFHEAGHATISWLCEHAHPLVKVTIVPRGMSSPGDQVCFLLFSARGASYGC